MTLKSLLQKPASKNAAASYLAFASSALWGLASIPLAVTYLKPEQIGLWAIVNALLGYLAWADLGIGPAIGRIMAPSSSAPRLSPCHYAPLRDLRFVRAAALNPRMIR